jgi:S1-C subfamily serine protease
MAVNRRQAITSAAALIGSSAFAFADNDKPLTETPPTAPPQMALTEQLLHETVLIECANRDGVIISAGTGFFFAFFNRGGTQVSALVTNKHVVDGAAEAFVTLTLQKSDGLMRQSFQALAGLQCFSTIKELG